jgi:phosphatidylglycerol:prolipoprotein diacylglycerol transferase
MTPTHSLALPRSVTVAGYTVNSYRLCLAVGLYSGLVASTLVARTDGIPVVRFVPAALFVAATGLIGARLYFFVATFGRVVRERSVVAWRRSEGGMGVLGGLVVVPASVIPQLVLDIPLGVLWDHLGIAIAVGGAIIRFGCICNGCCVGRPSAAWWAVRQRDLSGGVERRLPVQWLEIGWWCMAIAGLAMLWPRAFPPGSYGMGVLAWYGAGRVWLEPLRDTSRDSSTRLNRRVAAAMALGTTGLLVRLLWLDRP